MGDDNNGSDNSAVLAVAAVTEATRWWRGVGGGNSVGDAVLETQLETQAVAVTIFSAKTKYPFLIGVDAPFHPVYGIICLNSQIFFPYHCLAG